MFNIPTVNIKATGENIVKLRKKAGLSVKEIQNACGFGTPQAVYKWQQGQALPTVDNLLVLIKTRKRPLFRYLYIYCLKMVRMFFMFKMVAICH